MRIASRQSKLTALILFVMEKLSRAILVFVLFGTLLACKARKGCPTNGKNIGAERLLSGDPQAEKAARKAPKFKS
jgi:hypothetical protein